MNMAKSIGAAAAVLCLAFSGASCSKKTEAGIPDAITVISRESGSGTRGAFIELFAIEKKVDGKKVDFTADTADITNSTEVVITTVQSNKAAIGYISLGSLKDSVKALQIDGAEPSVAAIKSGSYKISRPFNIVTRTDATGETARDFIRFILSSDGQAVVEKKGYIAAAQNPRYMATGASGKITVAGSSSVYPVMEKLAEAYMELNPAVTVEVSQSDSTTGVNSALQGICDIGMASRELKAQETENGARATVIAIDGIAVIVNKANPLTSASQETVQRIYTGDITKWSAIR